MVTLSVIVHLYIYKKAPENRLVFFYIKSIFSTFLRNYTSHSNTKVCFSEDCFIGSVHAYTRDKAIIKQYMQIDILNIRFIVKCSLSTDKTRYQMELLNIRITAYETKPKS